MAPNQNPYLDHNNWLTVENLVLRQKVYELQKELSLNAYKIQENAYKLQAYESLIARPGATAMNMSSDNPFKLPSPQDGQAGLMQDSSSTLSGAMANSNLMSAAFPSTNYHQAQMAQAVPHTPGTRRQGVYAPGVSSPGPFMGSPGFNNFHSPSYSPLSSHDDDGTFHDLQVSRIEAANRFQSGIVFQNRAASNDVSSQTVATSASASATQDGTHVPNAGTTAPSTINIFREEPLSGSVAHIAGEKPLTAEPLSTNKVEGQVTIGDAMDVTSDNNSIDPILENTTAVPRLDPVTGCHGPEFAQNTCNRGVLEKAMNLVYPEHRDTTVAIAASNPLAGNSRRADLACADLRPGSFPEPAVENRGQADAASKQGRKSNRRSSRKPGPVIVTTPEPVNTTDTETNNVPLDPQLWKSWQSNAPSVVGNNIAWDQRPTGGATSAPFDTGNSNPMTVPTASAVPLSEAAVSVMGGQTAKPKLAANVLSNATRPLQFANVATDNIPAGVGIDLSDRRVQRAAPHFLGHVANHVTTTHMGKRPRFKRNSKAPQRPWLFAYKFPGTNEVGIYYLSCVKQRCAVFNQDPLADGSGEAHIRKCGGEFEDEADMLRKFAAQVTTTTGTNSPLNMLVWARRWNRNVLASFADQTSEKENV